ncbi:MAG TPA: MazG family protein, partial [Candidatus Limnocylindrales bacterium]
MHDWLAEAVARLGLDPAAGLQVAAAPALLGRPFDPGLPLIIVPAAGGADQPAALAGRQAHSRDAASLLRALYPADHPLHGLGGTPDTTVGACTAAQLAAGTYCLPALAWLDNVASPHALPWLVARLRAPDGCPWDREQDHLSLRRFLLEESYEVYDALEHGSTPRLAEELGDLLLQIVLHAHYAAEAGVFDLTDVTRATMAKIVRRHPHVFGDVVAESAADVVRNWEHIKAGERASRAAAGGDDGATDPSMPQAFAGLSRSLPALAYAQEMQERAAALGYDWPSVEGVVEKVAEEAAEIAA